MPLRLTVIRNLLALMIMGSFGGTEAASAATAPQRLTYQVQHSRYGNIGTYSNALEKNGDTTIVNTEAHINVGFLGIVLFRQDAMRQERWNNGRLVSFHGVTTTNGRTIEMNGAAQDDNFVMMTPDGDIVAPASVKIANPWSPELLRGDTLFTPDRGRLENVSIKSDGEKTLTINGHSTRTTHYDIYRVTGQKRYEVWLDGSGTPVKFYVYNPNGTIMFTLSS